MPDLKQIAVYDCETDGTDTEQAHIVTAFLGLMDVATGELIEKASWLINTGHEIPQGAIDVHGITNEKMQADGMSPQAGIFQITQKLNAYERAGIPVVIYNARFDVTLLDREILRYYPTMRPLDWSLVIDPLVIWKKIDKWRKGGRKLVDAAAAFGVPVLKHAHDAEADCIMAGQVAIEILKHPWIKPLTMPNLMKRTAQNAADQAASLTEYFHKSGKMPMDEHVEAAWPLIPRTEKKL